MRKVNDSPILHKIFMSYSTQNLKTVNLLVFMILNFLNEYLESNFNLSFSTKGSQKPIKEGFGYWHTTSKTALRSARKQVNFPLP